MLSHYIERAGVATTGISLIRENSAGLNVPRSVWVPFPFGRPLGLADAPDFQRDVLRAALKLTETATEPTILDYQQDAELGDPAGEWACSIMLPETVPADDSEALEQALLDEVRALAPWYDEALRKRQRTTVGASGLGAEQIETMARLLAGFASSGELGDEGAELAWEHGMPARIKFIADDLRAFYHEAVSAQPGSPPSSDAQLNAWVFGGTVLGDAIQAIVDRARESDDRFMRGAMPILMIPAGFARRKAS